MFKFVERFCHYLVVSFFVVAFFILAFFLSRGLDIYDEGSYLLASQYPHYSFIVTKAYFFTSLLFRLVFQDVYLFRLLGLLLIAGTGFGLGWVAYRLFANHLREAGGERMAQLVFSSFVGLGALLHYCWGIFTPGYNMLMAVAVNLSAIIVISFLLLDREPRPMSKAIGPLMFFSGTIVAFASFLKPPSGLFLFIYFVLVFFYASGSRRIRAGQLFLSMLLGIACFIGVYFFSIQNYQEFLTGLKGGWQGISITDNDIEAVVSLNILYFTYFIKIMFQEYGLECFIFAAWLVCLKKVSQERVAKVIFIIFFGLAVIHCARHSLMGGYAQLTSLATAYLFIIFCVITWLLFLTRTPSAGMDSRPQLFSRVPVLLAIFIPLPLIGAVGTNNPIFFNVLFFLAPWFVLTGRVIMDRSVGGDRRAGCLVILFLSFMAFMQTSTAVLFFPYGRQPATLRQNEPTPVGNPPSTIYLDMETNIVLQEMRRVLEKAGFQPGDNILAFSDMPGIVFALGGRSPVTNWWPGKYGVRRNHDDLCEYLLAQASPDEIRRAYVLRKKDRMSYVPDLSKAGISFPQDYVHFGNFIWPSTGTAIELWKPRWLHEGG